MGRETERETERERERDTETETERQRQRDRETETDRDRDRDRETKREIHKNRDRDRETETEHVIDISLYKHLFPNMNCITNIIKNNKIIILGLLLPSPHDLTSTWIQYIKGASLSITFKGKLDLFAQHVITLHTISDRTSLHFAPGAE